MQMIKLSVIALAVAAASTQMAVASQQSESNGFIADSKLDAHARVMYMNRDFRNDTDNGNNSYNEETGLGLKAIYESGFTQGTVGFGIDAFGLQGVKLDSGGGTHSNGLFPSNSRGASATKAVDNSSQAGAAVKMRLSNTTLKYGDQFVSTPVFDTGDSRLLPESASGFFVSSNEIENLDLHAGHFTALSAQNEVSQDSKSGGALRSIDFVGGRYNFSDNLSAAYYYSDADLRDFGGYDSAKKHYINANYTLPLADTQSINFDFNMYDSKYDQKGASSDRNKAYSLAAAYSFLNAHTLTAAYQLMNGDTAYLYDYDGGDAIYLANSVQINDFNRKDEQSFQARYDLDMATYGVEGLSFMTRYVRGSNIENADNSGRNNGKNWERNFEAKYVLQNGMAKDLAFRLRQATYRANGAVEGGTDINEVRLFVEYPLSIL